MNNSCDIIEYVKYLEKIQNVNINGVAQLPDNILNDDVSMKKLILKYNHNYFYRINNNLKNDYALIIYAVKKNGWLFKCLSEENKNNREMCLELLSLNRGAFEYLPYEFQTDKDFIKIIKDKGYQLYDFMSNDAKRKIINNL